MRRGSEKEPAALLLAFVGAVADGDDFEVCGGESLLIEAEFFRSARGDIEMAAGDERSAVVDAEFDGIAILEVGDLDEAGKRKRLVRTGEMPWHDFFTDGCVSAFEAEPFGFVVP